MSIREYAGCRPCVLFCFLWVAFGCFTQDVSSQSPSAALDAKPARKKAGVNTQFYVDPGWSSERFPDHAMCYRTAADLAEIYAKASRDKGTAVVSYEKPVDGSLRIVGTGHSFMMPGYSTLPIITSSAGLRQPAPVLHVGGGVTGSSRYKWEQENGIFSFDQKPVPKLLSSIAGGKWDAMMWGPFFHDRKEYYSCWIDFCRKHDQDMKFYLSDAWPQLDQLNPIPTTEDELTDAVVARMHAEKREAYGPIIRELNDMYGDCVFVLPTSRAMVLAVEYYHRGELPGVEGIHKAVGGHERSLWRDRLGHLGHGMESLEGYVFYATLYGRSPELIERDVPFPQKGDYPSTNLDRVFRKIAWQAAISDPMSGIVDKNKNGIADARERD
ncbi:hypothetical protein Poly51_07870 [Rubripirellula tenax]|uniref:Uncharacterized protein n=1 Tax=Rubripirellula tenax TaxID=2528015 RepID=A0A5C6FG49_9BACT|nr:hypothetical protein [Rubripirellula tenax]TWU60511.1 hypothetical protein Poly51_07870 [Rubripirellula tenax]